MIRTKVLTITGGAACPGAQIITKVNNCIYTETSNGSKELHLEANTQKQYILVLLYRYQTARQK
jgi:hypothetical protein